MSHHAVVQAMAVTVIFSFFRINTDNLLHEKGVPPIFSYRIARPVGMGLQYIVDPVTMDTGMHLS